VSPSTDYGVTKNVNLRHKAYHSFPFPPLSFPPPFLPTQCWKRSPQWDLGGRTPDQGSKVPMKLKHFWFLDVQWKPQSCLLFKHLKRKNAR